MTALGDNTETQYPSRILIAAILGAALGFLGASIVNVALPTFQTELGADATDLQWIVSAYNLAIAALLLSRSRSDFASRMADESIIGPSGS